MLCLRHPFLLNVFFSFSLLPSWCSNTVHLDRIYPKSNVGLPAASRSPTHHSQATNHHHLHQLSPWQRGRHSWHSSPFQSWWHRCGNNKRFIHLKMEKSGILFFWIGSLSPKASSTVQSFIRNTKVLLFFAPTLLPNHTKGDWIPSHHSQHWTLLAVPACAAS